MRTIVGARYQDGLQTAMDTVHGLAQIAVALVAANSLAIGIASQRHRFVFLVTDAVFPTASSRSLPVTLVPLTEEDRESFIMDNQRAFKYGATEEFGERDNHFEEDGEIISRKTIENSIDHGIAYRIREDGRSVGGLVLKIDEETQHNELELLFVNPEAHSKGIGYAAWQEVERLYPETKVWETCTPYFETRNIHFYVNKCGFHIVEFFNSHHPDPHDPETGEENDYEGEDFDGMFRFVKQMK